MLDASAYEHFYTDIKTAVRRNSQRTQFRMEETVGALSDPSLNLCDSGYGLHTPGPIQARREVRLRSEGCYLVRAGFLVSIIDLKACIQRTGTEDTNSRAIKERCMNILPLFPRDSLAVFINLLEDYISTENPQYFEGDVRLEFVQSGFVMGGFVPTMADYNKEGNFISIDGLLNSRKKQQRIYGTTSFGPTKQSRFSYILLKDEQDGCHEVWVAQVWALFHVSIAGKREEYAFVQYLECTPSLDNIDDELGCVCLRWATEDGCLLYTSPSPRDA